MKNYKSITQQYHSSNGLVRIRVTDAATGREILRSVTQSELAKIRRSGRKCELAPV